MTDSSGVAEFYRDFLNEEGYRAHIDEDGDVAFKYEGGNYFISIYKDDEGYFQLVFPSFWPIESAEEFERAKMACIETTRRMKAAKVFLVRDNTDVTATVEAFVDSREDVRKTFSRYIGAIQSARSTFRDIMRGDS